jgi:hypothetical protein
MDDLPETLNRIAARLDALERRIFLLEHPAAGTSMPAAAEATPASPGAAVAARAAPRSALAGGAFPVLGRAMLGIAGAFLLRALEESGTLPRPLVAAAAIVYAILWLVLAARVRDERWPASTTYACTSALILAPMLWELTLSFHLMPAAGAAAVLGGFAVVASLLASRRSAVLGVAHTAVAAVALVLAFATHTLEPFLAVLLLMTALAEYAALRGRATRVRIVVDAAADVGLWFLIFIYKSAPTARADYPALGASALMAPGLVLFAIVAAGMVWKTLALRKPITVYEALQTTIAFLLAASGLLAFAPPAGAMLLGIACMALAVVCYTALLLGVCGAAGKRTERVYGAWSAALLLAGGWLCLPAQGLGAWLSVAAIAAAQTGARRQRPALEWHAVVFLTAAAAASGLPGYAFRALAGTPAGTPGWSVYLVVVGAAYCYAAGKPRPEESPTRLVLRVVSAVLALAVLTALISGGLAGLMALWRPPEAHHLAFIRTITLCVAALVLAYAGARWRRVELTRTGYAVLVLVAAKLVLEDLRHGHLEFVAASTFVFALTLIAVPWLSRIGPGANDS